MSCSYGLRTMPRRRCLANRHFAGPSLNITPHSMEKVMQAEQSSQSWWVQHVFHGESVAAAAQDSIQHVPAAIKLDKNCWKEKRRGRISSVTKTGPRKEKFRKNRCVLQAKRKIVEEKRKNLCDVGTDHHQAQKNEECGEVSEDLIFAERQSKAEQSTNKQTRIGALEDSEATASSHGKRAVGQAETQCQKKVKGRKSREGRDGTSVRVQRRGGGDGWRANAVKTLGNAALCNTRVPVVCRLLSLRFPSTPVN